MRDLDDRPALLQQREHTTTELRWIPLRQGDPPGIEASPFQKPERGEPGEHHRVHRTGARPHRDYSDDQLAVTIEMLTRSSEILRTHARRIRRGD